jgi:putative sugar O-methyltransferase
MNQSFWEKHQSTIDKNRFRDNVHYLGIQHIYPYKEVVNHIKTFSKPWLSMLSEDNSFGVMTSVVENKLVSRDLLDSIVELEFLSNHCNLDLNNMKILDIGAGYGRLAHRMSSAFPTSNIYCTDKIEVSLEICEKYLNFRNVKNSKVVHPKDLDSIGDIDLAMNVHSFPECTRAEINEWLDWLVSKKIKKFFIVPHQWAVGGIYGQSDWDKEMFCIEDGKSFMPDILARGYKLEKQWRPLEVTARDLYLFTL